jgi:hypothetical protein
MKIEGCRYKIYAGKTKAIHLRLRDYVRGFQIHSPNDYKLQLFQEFMMNHDSQIKFDLYFQNSDITGYTTMETLTVRKFNPFINQRGHSVAAEKDAIREAFALYCAQIFERRLVDDSLPLHLRRP